MPGLRYLALLALDLRGRRARRLRRGGAGVQAPRLPHRAERAHAARRRRRCARAVLPRRDARQRARGAPRRGEGRGLSRAIGRAGPRRGARHSWVPCICRGAAFPRTRRRAPTSSAAPPTPAWRAAQYGWACCSSRDAAGCPRIRRLPPSGSRRRPTRTTSRPIAGSASSPTARRTRWRRWPGGARARRPTIAPARCCSAAPISRARAGSRGTRTKRSRSFRRAANQRLPGRAGGARSRLRARHRRADRLRPRVHVVQPRARAGVQPAVGARGDGVAREEDDRRADRRRPEALARVAPRRRLADAIARAAPGAPPAAAPSRTISGSGFLVSAEGHVVTNNHVVASCQRVTVAPGSTRRRSSRATCATTSRC